MGYSPKRICARAGCNNYATHGAYCEEHKKEVNRGTTSKYANYYARAWWKKNRKDFLLQPENFWCKHCLMQGRYTKSDTVHHSHGFNSWESFCNKEYWEAWNSACHSSYHTKITNEELYAKYQKEKKV